MASPPVVFIDFHGTLCHDRYWRSLSTPDQSRLQAFLFENNTELVTAWMRGRYSAEQINDIVANHLGRDPAALWSLFVADCQTMTIAPGVLERLGRLRGRAVTILITGNMDSFTRFTVPSIGLDKVFDIISNSFTEGRLKTDDGGAQFLDYARRFGTGLERCFLIDDAADVCALFSGLGGQALRVTPAFDLSEALHAVETALPDTDRPFPT